MRKYLPLFLVIVFLAGLAAFGGVSKYSDAEGAVAEPVIIAVTATYPGQVDLKANFFLMPGGDEYPVAAFSATTPDVHDLFSNLSQYKLTLYNPLSESESYSEDVWVGDATCQPAYGDLVYSNYRISCWSLESERAILHISSDGEMQVEMVEGFISNIPLSYTALDYQGFNTPDGYSYRFGIIEFTDWRGILGMDIVNGDQTDYVIPSSDVNGQHVILYYEGSPQDEPTILSAPGRDIVSNPVIWTGEVDGEQRTLWTVLATNGRGDVLVTFDMGLAN